MRWLTAMTSLMAALELVAVMAGESVADTLPGDSLPFASASFRATHNSFSGNINGARGSITEQLDRGVRFIELDIHDDDFTVGHDFRVGHGSPGDQVDPVGNTTSTYLRAWLGIIGRWSAAHPTHAPLTVTLDLKDDLTDNPSLLAGNLSALNQVLREVFGARLLPARDVPGALPAVGSLRGRVLAVLSGHTGSRREYRRDVGYNPAVAINARGQVVEVHDSGTGALWYWTGVKGADGRITWLRHSRYDTGTTPAVALNNNGALVEVHRAPDDPTLWYRAGQLGTDGEITWSAARRYDTGVLPTIRFVDPNGTTLREIHRSEGSSQNWDWRATLNPGGATVTWDGARHGKTSDALYQKAVAALGGSQISVWTGAEGGTPAQTLHYSTNAVTTERIRYEQVAFVEYQPTDSFDLQLGSLFWAGAASNTAFVVEARANRRVARGWDFDNPAHATSPLANYPATNHPYADWYVSLMDNSSVVS